MLELGDVDPGKLRWRWRWERFEPFARIISSGGDPRVCDDLGRLPSAAERVPFVASRSGYVQSGHQAGGLGRARWVGRATTDDHRSAVGLEMTAGSAALLRVNPLPGSITMDEGSMQLRGTWTQGLSSVTMRGLVVL